MKILWISNILFPEAEMLLSGSGELKSSGGWMLGAANSLLCYEDIELIVATVSQKVTKLVCLKGEKISYYIIPIGSGNKRINCEYDLYWKQINKEVTPDIVHIHGTEYSHGYSFLNSCGTENVVISIQGLLSIYYHYYCAGISSIDIFRNLTLRDLVKGTLLSEKRAFKHRGEYEISMLKMVNHIIGRTSWDYSHVWAINPIAKYYFCNETLRQVFYENDYWDYNNCKKYSIFISQSAYPIKGLHQLIKAMPIILKHYPDCHIRVAGIDITYSKTLFNRLFLTGYGKYIKSIIKKYKLEGKIEFIGQLNDKQMKSEYLNANVFVCPSSIENSPNSLGEAQILGTPCVASYVGGIPDMMKGNEECLYRFEDTEMLAAKICKIFRDADNQSSMRDIALQRHDFKKNGFQLYSIYKSIISKK